MGSHAVFTNYSRTDILCYDPLVHLAHQHLWYGHRKMQQYKSENLIYHNCCTKNHNCCTKEVCLIYHITIFDICLAPVLGKCFFPLKSYSATFSVVKSWVKEQTQARTSCQTGQKMEVINLSHQLVVYWHLHKWDRSFNHFQGSHKD